LLDLGIYPVSLAFFLLGAPSRVVGHMSIGSTGVDEQSGVLLGYSGGQLAVLSATLRSQAPNEAVILGSHGSIRIQAPFFRPHRISIQQFSEMIPSQSMEGGFSACLKQIPLFRKLYFQMDSYLSPFLQRDIKDMVIPFEGNAYQYEAAEVLNCIRNGRKESNVMPLHETIEILKVMDDIRKQCGLEYPADKKHAYA